MADDNCIFCLISDGRIPSTVLEVENDDFVIFQDIKPASQHHYLAVTKKHYASLKDLNKSHDSLGKIGIGVTSGHALIILISLDSLQCSSWRTPWRIFWCPREFLSMMPSSDSICRRLSRWSIFTCMPLAHAPKWPSYLRWSLDPPFGSKP